MLVVTDRAEEVGPQDKDWLPKIETPIVLTHAAIRGWATLKIKYVAKVWILTAKIQFSHALVSLGRTSTVGQDIFRVFVVPFEVVSMLLLAALVGAVVLARKD